jgi:hypothetical protein
MNKKDKKDKKGKGNFKGPKDLNKIFYDKLTGLE